MAILGRLHPLLIHFPIALVIGAVAAELAALVTADARWRVVAMANLRAGALFALLSAFAGWRLAQAPGIDASPLLEWHRWAGTIAAGAALTAAAVSIGVERNPTTNRPIYRIALFAAGALVTVAGHLGGLLVWGADFLRP